MKMKKLFAVVLSLSMVITLLAGCSNGSSDTQEDENAASSNVEPTTAADSEGTDDGTAEVTEEEADSTLNTTRDNFVIDPEKFKGKTLTIWTWWDMDEDSAAAQLQFEELTGAKIEWVNIPWADYVEKLISGVSAGTGPDICFYGPEAIPSYIQKNVILPISDYVDLSMPAFTKYSQLADKAMEYFTVDGKLYGIVDNGPGSFKLYYRKDLLENAGLEDPYELFMNGEWTWDKWFELMEGVTQDLDGDGVYDVWGFDAWMGISPFVGTNGTTFVKDGKFNVNTPEMIQSIEYYRKLNQPDYVRKPWEEGKDPQSNLISGATCFNYWGDYVFSSLRTEIGDNLGFVPFPKGPSATADMADDNSPGVFGIAACSQNPELAGLWFEFTRTPVSEEDWATKQQEKKDTEIATYGSEELVALAYEMGLNSVVNTANSYPGLNDVITKMTDDAEKTPAQAVNEYLSAGQALVDEVFNSK